MKYLEKLLEKSAPKRVNVGDDKDQYVSAGKTGQTTIQKRLMKGDSKKASPSADVRVSNYTAGPKGKLPDHTEYTRIGALMAEALGLLESAPGRDSFDHDAQQSAAEGKHGKEVQKSKRATANMGSGISRRMKSGEKPGYRGQKTTYKDDQTAGKKSLVSHTEYKRIGALMAEALGYRIDELAPLVAGAAKLAGRAAVGMAKKKAMGMAADKMKKKEMEEASDPTDKDLAAANKDVHTKKTVKGETPKETAKVNKSIDKAMGKKKVGAKGGIEGLKASIRAAGKRGQENLKKERQEAGVDDWTVYKQIGMALAEAREAYIDQQSKEELKAGKADAGFAGPMARGVSKPGGKGVAGAATKDKFVRSSIRRGGEAIKKAAKEKLGVDANPDKMATKNLAQVGKQLNKKRAKARGEGLPKETPEIAKADAKRDVYRRMAPGDK